MEKSKNGTKAQGADSQTVEIPEIGQIKIWLKRDLGMCISVLHGIHDDDLCLECLADVLQGRLINYQNDKANKENAEKV